MSLIEKINLSGEEDLRTMPMVLQLVEEIEDLALTQDNIIRMVENIQLNYDEFYKFRKLLKSTYFKKELKVRENQSKIELELIKEKLGYSIPLTTSTLKIGDMFICFSIKDAQYYRSPVFFFEVISIEGIGKYCLYKSQHKYLSEHGKILSDLKLKRFFYPEGRSTYLADYSSGSWKLRYADSGDLYDADIVMFIKDDSTKN